MEEEQAIVDIHIADGGASFIISGGVGKLVVVAKRFAGVTGTDTSGDVYLLAHYVVPYPVNGMDI